MLTTENTTDLTSEEEALNLDFECDCSEGDCRACHQQFLAAMADLKNQAESDYQKGLWGPSGIFWDPNDPICQELEHEREKE
jgi:hypothetical protein